MCTSDEVIRSPLTGSFSAAWVIPSFTNCVVFSQSWSDATGGVFAPGPYCHVAGLGLVSEDYGQYACYDWQVAVDAAVSGMLVKGVGGTYRVINDICTNPYPVSCCVPPSSTFEW